MITQILNYRQPAKDKLEKEYKEFKGNRYEEAMKAKTKEALFSFIDQDNEFAQAVVQGGNFKDCMKKVAAGVSGYISDFDAFRRAARFYFPVAEICFTMTIKTNPYEKDEPEQQEQTAEAAPAKEKKKSSALSLSLDDLF